MTDIAPLLVGQHVRLWPYSRGLYPRDVLYTLWRAIEDEGAVDKLFYAQQVPAADAVSTRGDLVEFVRYFDDPGKRILLITMSVKTDELVGAFWLDDLFPGVRAAANCFYRRRYWGPAAAEATRIGFAYAFATLGLQALWAYTPWPEARRHALRQGMTEVAVLPGFVPTTPARDLSILKVTREAWDGMV